ncbi:protoporphyrinogen oxidase [Nocardioides donggukensis]|uniref:Coproporphyrinogen III oxidase n=1 Tax=Nocardioides donggukensis TaxID=2774019 RepID=A0A927K648_9ACTN|nr:protoporphyrinogen oxidase [Nocardioides donggukensis]MBD8870528.1 protoporphyrinogen oxidase [Nocardioides donggukensis]
MGRTVVIGAGIAGLAAARLLARDGGEPDEVLVLEASAEVGGKLRLGSVAGVPVDLGAEAMLNRRPEATDLARSLGLDLVHPATTTSAIWTRDRLRPLPRSVLGVPADLDQLAGSGVLSADGLARAREERVLPAPDGDQTVADFVGSRLGGEVVDRLVEPLLGGVYAGHASVLSARATIPQVVALLDRDPSLLSAAAATPPSPDVPVFAGLAGGVGRLPQVLAERGGFTVRRGTTVRELRRTASGFELTVGPTPTPELIEADRVLVAVPAAPAARLLGEVAPVAAAELAGIEYASMAVVTLAFRTADVAGLPRESSGFLVPPVDGRRIKAATFSAHKWDWVREAGSAEDVVLLRTSLGRHREEATLQRSDEELVADSVADLAAATGITAAPVDAHVQRWGGALPQYAVGHRDRVARIRADLAVRSTDGPGRIAVCGAAYDGLGIPACIASARAAVVALA